MSDDSPKSVHHPTFYFPEGDIILSTLGDDSASVLFRVHKVILSQASPIFASMFALPEGATQREESDGVPSVDLHDSAENVEALLHALYNPGLPVLKARDPDFYSITYRLVEMARKYDVLGLQETILSRLRQDWPEDVAEYWRFNADWKTATHDLTFRELNLKDRNKARGTPTYLTFPDPASAIRLAVDYDVPSILPAAFYVLSTTDPNASWLREEEIRDWEYSTARLARWDMLHPSEKERAIRGRQKLLESMKNIANLFDVRHNQCAARDSFGDEKHKLRCSNAAERLKRAASNRYERYTRGQFEAVDPIAALAEIYNARDTWGVCVHCEVIAKQRISRMIHEIWNSLPQIFDLI